MSSPTAADLVPIIRADLDGLAPDARLAELSRRQRDVSARLAAIDRDLAAAEATDRQAVLRAAIDGTAPPAQPNAAVVADLRERRTTVLALCSALDLLVDEGADAFASTISDWVRSEYAAAVVRSQARQRAFLADLVAVAKRAGLSGPDAANRVLGALRSLYDFSTEGREAAELMDAAVAKCPCARAVDTLVRKCPPSPWWRIGDPKHAEVATPGEFHGNRGALAESDARAFIIAQFSKE